MVGRLNIILFLAWIAVVVVGLGRLWRYETAPGIRTPLGSSWPADSALTRGPGRSMLLLFAHPRCPCTRASLHELARIIAQSSSVSARVLFYKPRNAPAGWEKTDLYRQAAAIPGVTVLTDTDGVEAHRFHAITSGQTLLFDSNRQLLFSGGITLARGHEGDNAGEQALLALLTGASLKPKQSPVFGCTIQNAVTR